ncbi:MAG: hypothetical protein MK132_15875 [Lentisphaerales bacterium]|nr:hypothetical protein [Lentisphaerales bacterium]
MLNSKGRNRLEGKLEVAIKHLKAFEKSPWKEIDGIFAVCRVALGGILMWKCAEFYFDRDVQMELFAVTGVDWFFPMAWAHIVILAHFMGAMCLFAGWATSFAAILQIPILVGAVLWVKLPTVLQVQQLEWYSRSKCSDNGLVFTDVFRDSRCRSLLFGLLHCT